MTSPSDQLHNLAEHCDACREAMRDRFAAIDRRLLALEITVRGEDGHNGMKSQLKTLCDRFDAFEKKAIRVIAIASSLPGVAAGVIGVLRVFGKL